MNACGPGGAPRSLPGSTPVIAHDPRIVSGSSGPGSPPGGMAAGSTTGGVIAYAGTTKGCGASATMLAAPAASMRRARVFITDS